MTNHVVLGTPIKAPVPPDHGEAFFAMGCFWGVESLFWQLPGVYTTAVGFAGGTHPAPTDDLIRSGVTGHAETVRVVFDPTIISYPQLLQTFWETHDPTQGNRQGPDVGSHCRSAIYCTTEEQLSIAEASRATYQPVLIEHGLGPITTEIRPAGTFHYADDKHQQLLAKHRGAMCSHTRQPWASKVPLEKLAVTS